MSFELWFGYVTTVLILMITPGPSQLLMLSNSLGQGFRRSKVTAVGDLTANALQMIFASAGLASILYASEYTFLFIKWIGVAYMIFIGIKQILSKQEKTIENKKDPRKPLSKLYTEGFLTSASNPKAIIFFAALFPQFLNANAPILPQLCLLGITYLTVDGMFLSFYGIFADWIARRYAPQNPLP